MWTAVRPDDPNRYDRLFSSRVTADTLEHLSSILPRAAAPRVCDWVHFSAMGGRYWDIERRDWRHVKKNRDEIKHRFLKGEIDLLLLLTDAAAEGLNLQSAALLINYDFAVESDEGRATHRPNRSYRSAV